MKTLLYLGDNYGIKDLFCITLEKDDRSRYKQIRQIYPWEI